MTYQRKEQIGECKWFGELIGFPRQATIYAIEHGGGVVYVGSTEQKIQHRIRSHVRDAKKGSTLPIHEWMRNQAFRFDVRFLEVVDSESRHEAEKKWIEHYGFGLLNLTNGGLGLPGHKFAGTGHAEKIRDKLRKGANCNCENCGAEFWRKPRDMKLGHCRFCSRECYQEWQRGKPKGRAA